jgi:pimeloyl-ACP methyl ester carboxylesterase
MPAISYRTIAVGDTEVFYREAGAPDAPALLLLHGFPTSSHMFRDLIPKLAHRYRLIAPDLPGFGLTKTAPGFTPSFDAIAHVIDGFTQALKLARYALYVFDYGAPTGFRLAMWHPERVTAIISQSGNAYAEGLSKEWEPWQRYWREPSAENREACRIALQPDIIRDFQYLNGADAARVSPDGYTLDSHYLERPGADAIQLDLILDYRSNVALYPDFQRYFRDSKPPLLATWGRNDAFFLPAGAEAFRRDLPEAEVHLLDTGHFALETHAAEIAALIDDFLTRKLTWRVRRRRTRGSARSS